MVTAVGARPTAGGRAVSAAALPTAQVLRDLQVPEDGLSSEEAARRLKSWDPNAVRSHRARAWLVLWHQLRSPLPGLLLAAALVPYFMGERSDAVIIALSCRGRHRRRGRVREYRRRPERTPAETEFQVGLRRFSMLLVYVAGALTTSIFFEWSLSQQPEHGGPARSVPDPHSSDTAAVVVTSWTTSPLL